MPCMLLSFTNVDLAFMYSSQFVECASAHLIHPRDLKGSVVVQVGVHLIIA
jgi:hypothetical protein